jgi:hypothetical protein
MAISPINIASSTAPNWLKEAQESLAASENSGGLLGALQSAKNADGSIKTYLANGAKTAGSLALMSQNALTAAGSLALQMADAAAQKRADDKLALSQKLNPVQTNHTPPHGLDPVIYFDDGTTLDTVNNILTKLDGTQIDTTTGQNHIEPGSLIQLANGAYLDTKNNILTLPDGTRIDTITGINLSV